MTVANIGMTQQVSGHIALQVLNASGDVVREIPEFRNLILNSGLDYLMATSASLQSMAANVKVGTGAGSPSASDTTLPGFLLGTAGTAYAGAFQTATAPYYYEATYTYLFALGAINATLTCIGAHSSSAGSSVFAWSQIKDSGNNPTTLTVLGTEQLSVTYKFRVYAPVFTTSGNITVAGDATHAFTMFAHNFGSSGFGNASGTAYVAVDQIVANSWTSFTDPANIFSSLSITGQSVANLSMTQGSYTNGSFTRTLTGFMSTSSNVTGNAIKGIALQFSGGSSLGPRYMMKLGTNIAKDSTKTLTLTFSQTIARYP
jgi:hypothetical protein